MADWINATVTMLSVIITAASLVFAYMQYRKRVTIAQIRTTQLSGLISEIGMNVPSATRLKEMLNSNEGPDLCIWVGRTHQFICSLYRTIITYYLSPVKDFGDEELEHLVNNGVIRSDWTKTQWKRIIALRETGNTDE